MLKHYVQFIIPNYLSSELIECEVPAREHAHVSAPPNALGYRFFDREIVREGRWTKTSDPENRSKTYFLVGEIKSLDDLRGVPGNELTVHNMETNGYSHVLEYGGSAYLCDADDVVLETRV